MNDSDEATPAGKVVRADIQILGQPEVQGYNAVPALAPGQSAVIDIGLENCYPPAGSFKASAVVDIMNEIDESNETNNTLQKVIVNGTVPKAPVLNTPAENYPTCPTSQLFSWKAVTTRLDTPCLAQSHRDQLFHSSKHS